jgi:hypothetical protein
VTFNPAEFADDTDLERLVLERLGTHRVRVADPHAIYDRRGKAGGWNTTVRVGMVEEGIGPREELRRSLRPLGFAAAYKVLDMLVEHVLQANGAGTARLTFQQKTRSLRRRPTNLPVPLDTHPGLWDRLAALYARFQEPRHAVTHRRAQATAAGDLEIYDDGRQLVDTISNTEIESFAAAVHTAAELVIDARDDSRRANIAAWHLNTLRSRHALAVLPATDPNAHRRLLEMDLIELGGGCLRFEVARAREIVDHQPKPSLWDLRLHAGGRVFVGHWEEVPDQFATLLDFHPASPPTWLSEEVP